MKPFFHFFVAKHKLSFLLAFFFVFLGLAGFKSLKRETRPPVDFARARITTVYSGASPAEIEEQITNKIEEEIRSVRGLKKVTSVSQPGLSSISVTIDMDNVETKEVVDELQRSLQKTRGLPSDLLENPSFFYMNAKEIPIIELALVGSNTARKRDLLADELKNIIEDDPGVAEVRLSGFRKREFQILLKPDAMTRYHVGIKEVLSAVRRQTKDIPAGYIRTPGDQRLVRVTGKVREAKDLGNIVVRANFSGQMIRIRDIAQVKDHNEDPSTLVRVNGDPATLIIVSKKEQADTIKTVTRIQKRIKEFEERLGTDYKLITYDNESKRIAKRLQIVIDNALLGLVLVLFILLYFLPGYLGLVAAISLPLSILGTVGLMPLLGVNFNNITMLALVIAIGMLVDNSVVISENYARIRLEGVDRVNAALKASHQFWLPLTATVATTIVAFLPMLVTKGVMGEFIKWIPIMVTIALSMSIIEAFFLLPARLKFTVRDVEKYKAKNNDNNKSNWFDKFQLNFEKVMSTAIVHRYKVLIVIASLLISSILLAAFGNRFELFPAEQVEYYFASFETPIKTTIEKTDQYSGEFSKKIIDLIGKENVKYTIARAGVSRVGGGGSSKTGSYVGMVSIAMTDDAANNLKSRDVLKKLRTLTHENFTKVTYSAARGGPPVGDALSVSLRSNNDKELFEIVKEIKKEVKKIDGVVDLQDDQVRGGPEYRLIPNQNAISRFKLTTEDIGVALRSALQGAIVSEMSLNGEEVRIKIRYNDKDRAKLESFRNTKIMEPSGRLIPLTSVVDIVESEAPAVRKHYDFKRSVTISSDVEAKKITSLELNKKVRKIVTPLKEKYPAVNITFGGEEESTKESTSSLKNAMIIAIFAIFAILVFLFNSFGQSILILSSITLGLIGVSWSFFLHQRPLSFLALIGVVGLAGVVVNSAIVLVSYINDLKAETNLTRNEILAKASSHRLKAVMVTSLTTVGGLFPTAYGIGGYDAILVPMTLALAWGLVSGTLLTLIWVPCGYAIMDDIKLFVDKKIFKKNMDTRGIT